MASRAASYPAVAAAPTMTAASTVRPATCSATASATRSIKGTTAVVCRIDHLREPEPHPVVQLQLRADGRQRRLRSRGGLPGAAGGPAARERRGVERDGGGHDRRSRCCWRSRWSTSWRCCAATPRSCGGWPRSRSARPRGAPRPRRRRSRAAAGRRRRRGRQPPRRSAGPRSRGDSVTLSFGRGSPVTLLAFLTSGCTSCAPLWAGLHEARDLGLAGAAGGGHHPRRHAREPHAPGAPRALRRPRWSWPSAAWADYAVPARPTSSSPTGRAGSSAAARRSAGPSSRRWWPTRAPTRAARPIRRARTAERAERAEGALASAGIGPGHPSLYPGASGRPDEQDR